jgi:hypothetical protein
VELPKSSGKDAKEYYDGAISMKKIDTLTWKDIQSTTKNELKEMYGVSDRQVEQAIRKNMPGAGQSDYEKQYKDFYERK